ncbi:MAG: CHAT domain-containing protein [Leptolyngbyaceae cyanobacterium bins.302]|nr:CHAT domain-containing protein [Leptolyngbyaceae cyanobacterium bins.302]
MDRRNEIKRKHRQGIFRKRRWLGWGGLAILTMLLCSLKLPVWATLPATLTAKETSSLAQSNLAQAALAQGSSEETGKTLYEAGRFNEAAIALEQTIQKLRAQNNTLQLAATLANLSLVYQQLGQFEQATQAITESLQLVAQPTAAPAWQVRAQALDVQGRLLLLAGDGEKAIVTWQQAEASYRQIPDEVGVTKAQLNQAQALRSLGFSRRALDLLSQINQRLQTQPDSRQKVAALRALGDTLQLVGDLPQAEISLKQSLTIAQELQLPGEISATLLSLGNTVRAQKNTPDAIAYYQQAASIANTPLSRVQAQLNHLNLLIDDRQWLTVQALLPQISPNLDAVPPSRAGIYARINFAQALLRLGSPTGNERESTAASTSALSNPQFTAPSPFAVIPYPRSLSQLLQGTLKTAIQHASQLSDARAESYALGTLGTAYEQTGQFKEAKEVTQKALVLAQSTNTWDVAYRWQWQLGRLERQSGNVQGAIAAYDAAITNLTSLRSDLAAVNSEVQFNFRDSVAPIYRQSVELLLQSEGGNPQEKTLDKARQRIEDLQLAELDNFFRRACLEGKQVPVDDVVDKDNPTTSIVYPIVLQNPVTQTVTIQVIAKIPNQPLKRYSVAPMPRAAFEQTIERLQKSIADVFDSTNRRILQTEAQKLYSWLVEPLENDIRALETAKTSASPKVDTLVFILDDALRNVPMAVLWDGQQYLVEKYGIALSLGLQLFDPKPIAREPLRVLAAGLSEPPPNSGFTPLPAVQSEIAAISRLGVPTTPLLNQEFTSSTLSNKINADPFNVVHLATHGQFSSRVEDTFILASDGRINVTQFDRLLRSRDITRPEAIQLLVLSACQTATNDNRATLGLAGFAIRAGARSTLASLRNANDQSTSLLIENFYQELNNPKQSITKAEALRRSQVALLNSTNYRSPQYWAPYVLIGNWL